jgi:hypothetical protein
MSDDDDDVFASDWRDAWIPAYTRLLSTRLGRPAEYLGYVAFGLTEDEQRHRIDVWKDPGYNGLYPGEYHVQRWMPHSQYLMPYIPPDSEATPDDYGFHWTAVEVWGEISEIAAEDTAQIPIWRMKMSELRHMREITGGLSVNEYLERGGADSNYDDIGGP